MGAIPLQGNVYFKRLMPMFAGNSFIDQNKEKYNVEYVVCMLT